MNASKMMKSSKRLKMKLNSLNLLVALLSISANQLVAQPTGELAAVQNAAAQQSPSSSSNLQQKLGAGDSLTGSRSAAQQPQVAPSTLQQSSITSTQQQQSTNQQQQQSVSATNQFSGGELLPKLPNIDIFISRQEMRKLLGLDKRIDYVTNGNINTYPFGFTIPMGYNQSDIIFTWRNMGPLNVNYSISLVIGNIQAVDAPLINITRSGLIPKQEQVFKITLPCSGKVTDEVDVQVLINVSGLVLSSDNFNLAASNEPEQTLSSPASAATDQQQQAGDSMQSDEPVLPSGARLVSHTLAIKRKKICTMHPVQVAPKPQVARAPLQPQHPVSGQQSINPAPQPVDSGTSPQLANRWAAGSSASDQSNQQRIDQPPNGDSSDFGRKLDSTANLIPSLRNNQQPARPTTTATGPAGFYSNWPQHIAQQPTGATSGGRLQPPTLSPIPPENPLNELILTNSNLILSRQQQQQQQMGLPPQQSNGASQNPFVLTLVGLSLLVCVALVVVVVLGSSSSHGQSIEKLGSLTSCILRRAPASRSANKCKSPMAGAVISSLRSGPKSSAMGHGSHNKAPSHLSAHGHQTLASASPISGLGRNFGQHTNAANKTLNSHLSAGYYFKQQQQQPNGSSGYSAGGYYATTGTGNQYHYSGGHHYQQPPTADLLGTGYQCQPPPPPPPSAQQPICHIATGNTSQTTRLIWNNGNGTSPDGFTIDGSYMPLSNAPRSDSGGSAYQSIY